jgi:hypothetical protein
VKDPIADVLLPEDTPDDGEMRVGTVTDNSPVEVTIAGGTGLSAAYCARYTPAINDVVLVWQTKTDLIIIDQINSGG